MSEKKVDDWGPSKENIRPIQQGRKTKCLKVALAPTEDVKELQEYEIELLTYSGADPLSVWCKYIRCVELNFPKGKREEQIKDLIERSLLEFRNEKRYFNDDRFIDMVLKYAILAEKPINVYRYMFSHEIGCRSAVFYINWSRELEQLGNLKKAADVLTEGIQRRAEPIEKLQSYYQSFEIRLGDKLKSNSMEDVSSSESSRSAFALVKPQKKNVPSTSCEAVTENKKVLLGRQQPQPESIGASSKVPFKISNSENVPPSQFPIPSNQNFEIYNESEQSTSKGNSVNLKTLDHSLQTPNRVKQTFKFYCDENERRPVPKKPKVPYKDSKPFNPPIAVFEPEDPLKKPMYPKDKVYRGGTEEFSLEEIRAAEWLDEKKRTEKEHLIAEQQKKIEEHRKAEEELKRKVQYLTKQVELLQSHLQNSSQKLSDFPETGDTVNTKTKRLKTENVKIIENYENSTLHACNNLQNSSKSEPTYDSLIFKSSTDCFENRDTEKTGYSDAVNMFQELYNKSLYHPVVENEHKRSLTDEFSKKCSLMSSTTFPERDEVNQQKDTQACTTREYNCDLPFTFYRDPTGVIDSNEIASFKNSQAKEEGPSTSPNLSIEGDTENIPPNGYVQESSKRDLAGILQPSKNILFIPLEEQEEMEDDSDGEENYLYYNERQYTDDTLIPPSNTEQFKAAQFLSSTPYFPRNKSPALEKSEHQIKSNDGPAQHVPTENLNATVEELNDQENKMQAELKFSKEYNSLPRVSKMLSVIMETSREAYSKSSNSSASLTRSNNIDQVLSNHISGPKQYSKLETCEPSTLNSISEVHGISNTNCKNFGEIPDDGFHSKTPLQIVDLDPFDREINCNFLKSVNLNEYKNLYYVNKSMRGLKEGETIHVGNESYRIISLVAEGGYGKVYEANMGMGIDTKKFALKVCKNSDEYEFYICNELRKRLLDNKIMLENINFVTDIISAEKFLNGIIIVSKFGNLGTLLDIVSFSKTQSSIVPEMLIKYFALEILLIVSKLHKCNIIHGDIKPDNFLIINDAFDNNPLEKSSEVSSLQLIDFGRAIDLNFYKKGTCFTYILKKIDFRCNEMKDNKPWVYQLDWYGVASCIHALLFSEYLNKDNVTKANDVWVLQNKIRRYWCVPLWKPLFKKLLNIPECYQEPDLQPEIDMIQSELQQNSIKFKHHFNRFGKLYKTGKKTS